MSAQRAPAPVRIAAFVAAAAAVVLAAVLAVRVAGRREPPPPAAAPPPPAGVPVDRKERVRHEEFRDGRLAVSVRGDLSFRGADGREHLTGAVEVVRHGPAGETVVRLTAGEVAFTKGELRFTVTGGVRIEAGGAALEGEAFLYDETAATFGTSTGGRFTAGGLSGEAQEVVYDDRTGEVRLGGGFRAGLGAAGGGTLTLAGASLSFSRGSRRGRMTGPASLAAEGFRAEAAVVSFLASADGSGLETAVLEGGAVLASRSGTGNTESVAASAVRLDFPGDDARPTWSASGGVRAETAGPGDPGRTLLGEEARCDAAGVLRVAGGTGGRAAAESAEARFEAPAISVETGTGDLAAEGGVAGVLKKSDGARRTGFFGRDEDVAASCRTLRMKTGAGTVLLSGEARVRQGSAAVRGGEIELSGDDGRMRAGGGVTVALAVPASGGRPERAVELAGRDMAYAPGTRTLTLSGRASVGLPDARLEAGSLAAVLGPDGRTFGTLTAAGGVVVAKGAHTGRAEAASYDAAAARLVLTGRAVLVDAEGGAARGDKLTFDLADDKIFLENEGTGRTSTVIRK